MMAVAGLLFASCASKKDLVNCQTENKSLTESLQSAKEDLAAKNARLTSLEEQLKQQQRALAESKKAYEALQNSLDKSLTNASQNNISIEKLVDQINESNQYIRHLVEVKSKSDSLNMVLQNNLTRSIAKIIKDYKDYDVLIEGNTDNVPITKQNIRNNWDLSCLRASSVVQALQNKYGVDPKRLTAGGRGEYNPIADNNSDTGKQRNRRTQIIITPKLDEFMELIGQAPTEEK